MRNAVLFESGLVINFSDVWPLRSDKKGKRAYRKLAAMFGAEMSGGLGNQNAAVLVS